MPSEIAQLVAGVVAMADQGRTSQHMKVAAVSMLIYDYLITFGDEVKYVWTSPMTTLKIAFLVGRYVPFASVIATLYANLTHSYPGDTACIALAHVYIWLLTLSIIASQVVQILRTFALYERSRIAGWALGAIFTVSVVAVIPLNVIHLKSITMSPLPPLFTLKSSIDYQENCGYRMQADWAALSPQYIIILAVEFIVVVLTCWRYLMRDRYTITTLRKDSNSLIRVLYNDGFMYFMYIFAFSLANVLVLYVDPTQYHKWPFHLQGVLHSCLSTRIVIHIRRSAAQESYSIDEPLRMSVPRV